jgi:hypothetical protein
MAGVAVVGGAQELQLPLDCPAGPFGTSPKWVTRVSLGRGFFPLVCIPAMHWRPAPSPSHVPFLLACTFSLPFLASRFLRFPCIRALHCTALHSSAHHCHTDCCLVLPHRCSGCLSARDYIFHGLPRWAAWKGMVLPYSVYLVLGAAASGQGSCATNLIRASLSTVVLCCKAAY